MTARDDLDRASPEFDRLMTAWFDAEARVRERDDLLERTLSRTSRARPRPAWLLPERWIPMELTMRRVRVPRAMPYLALLAVLVLLVALALIAVGSQRNVPAPFGPAANGSMFFASLSGDIVSVDAATSTSTVLFHDVEPLAHPAISLRGTHVAFVRSGPDGRDVDVADVATMSTVRVSTTPMGQIPHDFAWSPDDRQLAWISDGDLWLAQTDGSGSRRIDVGMTVSDVSWRPPKGAELLIRAAPGSLAGFYLMKPDGSGLHPITAVDGSEYMYTEADWAPDGARLAYSDAPPIVVHVLTIEGLIDQSVPPRPGAKGTLFPKWSPDGTMIALLDWRADGDGRVAIVRADDIAGAMVDTGPSFDQGPDFVWSPDGRLILAIGWNSDRPWLLDPSGGAGRETTWTLPGGQSFEGGENILLNVWQRLAS